MTTVPDIYWGEFPEAKLDEVLALMRASSYKKARDLLVSIDREDFIYGKARSNFIYYLHLRPDAVTLDVGCGLGAHSFNIAPYVGRVEGIDQSKKRVEFCALRAKAEGVSHMNFLHSDIASLSFGKNSFDNILMNGVVEWLGEANRNLDPREDQVEALTKLRSMLRSGGRLYIGIENRWAIAYLKDGVDHSGLRYTSLMPRRLADVYTRLRRGKPYRTYTYGRRGYVKLLKDSGFNPEKISFYIAHPGYNLPQYLIPFDDIAALRFFLTSLSSEKGWKGVIARWCAKSDMLLKCIRHLFFSFAIYAEV